MVVVSAQLPGADLVERGLADLSAGRATPEAALVSMAATRLRRLGFEVAVGGDNTPAGHQLYARLVEQDAATAYSRYNALTRRLLSFLRAAD